jgi:hypothetical protein
MRLARIVVPLVLLAAITACPHGENPPKSEMLLRSYPIPNGVSPDQVRRTLAGLFSKDSESRVQSSDGMLVVLGPEGVQEGARSFLEALSHHAPPPAPPSIKFTYWIVRGSQSKAAEIPTELQEIAPALQAVAKAQGSMRFDEMERLELLSADDDSGETQGRSVMVKQQASTIGGKVVARIEIELPTPGRRSAKLETRVSLNPDQLLVLGETGDGTQEGAAQHDKLFYVVRPTIQNADAR